MAGDHLAWQSGRTRSPWTCARAEARLIGNAGDAQSLTPPVVSPGAAAVAGSTPRDAREQTLVYVYDFSSDRRRLLLETDADLDTPAVAGDDRVLAARPGQCDRRGGLRHRERPAARAGHRQRSGPVPAGRRLTRRLVAPGSAVGALHADDARHCRRHDDRSRAARVRRRARSSRPPILAGGTLAWLRVDEQGTAATISTYDLRTLAGPPDRCRPRPGRRPPSTARRSSGRSPPPTGGGEVVMGLAPGRRRGVPDRPRARSASSP